MARRLGFEVIPGELLRPDEKQSLAIGRPAILRRREAAQAGLLAARCRRQKHVAHARGVHQHAALAGGRVRHPDFRVFTVAAEIAQRFAVGTPAGVTQDLAAQAGCAVDALDGEVAGLLLRERALNRRETGGAQQQDRNQSATGHFLVPRVHVGLRKWRCMD